LIRFVTPKNARVAMACRRRGRTWQQAALLGHRQYRRAIKEDTTMPIPVAGVAGDDLDLGDGELQAAE
jgi:hypothetical protein